MVQPVFHRITRMKEKLYIQKQLDHIKDESLLEKVGAI